MQIKSLKSLSQFKFVTAPGNTATYNDTVKSITLTKTTSASENCYANLKLCAINPSDVYEISILARKVSGASGVLSVAETGGTNGPSTANSYNYVEISSGELQWYTLRTTVRSLNAHSPTSPIVLTLIAGYNDLVSGSGSIEILDFKLKLVESSDIAPRIAFMGNIRLNNGTVWVNAGMSKHSLDVSVTDNSIVVTSAPKVASTTENAMPLILTQEITNLGLHLKQVSVDGLLGTVTFKVYNNSNAEVNLSSTIADFNVIAAY